MSSENHWGPWLPWDATSALWPPQDAPEGALVEADLVVRATRIGENFPDNRPNVLRHVFTVTTGEAFVMYPSWCEVISTHLVTGYRVWGGTEEEYLKYLLANAGLLEDQGEAADT